jgi:hypothetical protein
MDALTRESEINIQYLGDNRDYNDTHERDFKLVFFKPEPNQIKSSNAGVFVKDIYGKDPITPVYQVPGDHTSLSCKMNTAIYANSQIDYNSSTKYVPGVNQVEVKGDFKNSPNYFLSPTSTEDTDVSVEITGYIAADAPGDYKVIELHPFTKNALIWVGNNALKTYRKENALFSVENGVKTKNYSFRMVAGEYRSFRIQYSGNTQFDYKNLWATSNGSKITTFATNTNENNLFYYSLTPSDKINFYKCDIYKGSELQKYKSDAKQQVTLVWSTSLYDNTEYVFLDMIGNLCEYDSTYNKLNILNQNQNTFEQYPKITNSKDRYRLKLYQRNLQPLCIKDNSDIVTPIITIPNLNTVRNEEWAKSPNPMIDVMSNEEQLVDNKMISIDRISESNPLFSVNFRYKLCIMRDNNGKKILALLASSSVNRKFYSAEPDIKMNKLFYASTFDGNKFLREVPTNLQINSDTYTKYSDMYPSNQNFTETNNLDTNNCEKQCNTTPGCNYFYKVTKPNVSGENCLIPTNNNNNISNITYLPKQSDSAYSTSELNIKNKTISTGNGTKDTMYKTTKYIANGYEDGVNAKYSKYRIETNVVKNTDTPGPYGTSYVVELQNNVNQTTNSTRPISITNIKSSMNAGRTENFTNVVEDSLTKLNQIDGQIRKYENDMSRINPNRIDISNNITSINQTYLDMSGNQEKYDFTGQIIYALEKEDRSLTAALLKDNVIYKEEQNTVYVITTLTMATLLVAAILVSK